MSAKGEPPSQASASELPLTMSSAMASLGRYHEYLWSFVQPWLGQRVLEVGVGFGQYTRRMLAEKRRVLGCDPRGESSLPMSAKGEPPSQASASELPLTMSSAMASLGRYHEYLWSFVI